MDNPEILADKVQNNEHLYLLNAIPGGWGEQELSKLSVVFSEIQNL